MRDAVAKAARAKVHADPDSGLVIGEHVDIVIAAADGAELLARLGAQAIALVAIADRVPRGILEQRIVRRRIVRAVPATDPERQRRLNLVGQLAQPDLDRGQLEIGADRRVAAGDVEPHAHDRHLVPIRGDATDRHDISQVPIRHERGTLGAARDIAQLLESVGLVRAENLDVSHAASS